MPNSHRCQRIVLSNLFHLCNLRSNLRWSCFALVLGRTLKNYVLYVFTNCIEKKNGFN